MRIIRSNQMLGESEPGSEERFTGIVDLQRLKPEPIRPAKVLPIRMLRSSFKQTARSYWHTHPSGQILYVESGRGRVGWKDMSGMSRVEEIGRGDTVIIEPDEKHWHGAAPDIGIVQLAVHVDSFFDESYPVSEDDYGTSLRYQSRE